MTTAEATVVPVEYLYGNWSHEDQDGYIVTSVVEFLVIKKTAKRIFYAAGYERTRSIDRQALEQTGSAYNRSRGAWSPDYQLFAARSDAQPPQPETTQQKVTRLRAQMAAAHPDVGGDPAAFRAAYASYKAAAARLQAEKEQAV